MTTETKPMGYIEGNVQGLIGIEYYPEREGIGGSVGGALAVRTYGLGVPRIHTVPGSGQRITEIQTITLKPGLNFVDVSLWNEVVTFNQDKPSVQYRFTCRSIVVHQPTNSGQLAGNSCDYPEDKAIQLTLNNFDRDHLKENLRDESRTVVKNVITNRLEQTKINGLDN